MKPYTRAGARADDRRLTLRRHAVDVLNLKQVLRSTFPLVKFNIISRRECLQGRRASNYFAPRPPAATACGAARLI